MRERYDAIRSPAHCTCLKQKVHFNARGFHHLLYDGSGKARTIREARSRLILIPLIEPVLRTAQDSSYEKRYARKNRKKNSPSIKVEMWGLEATVGTKKPSRIKWRALYLLECNENKITKNTSREVFFDVSALRLRNSIAEQGKSPQTQLQCIPSACCSQWRHR